VNDETGAPARPSKITLTAGEFGERSNIPIKPHRTGTMIDLLRLRHRVRLAPYRRIVRIGSDYGGWSVPDDRLGAESICYSVGVGDDMSFDVGLIKQYGCTVHAFDPTPKAVAYAAAQQVQAGLHFHPVGLWSTEGEIPFHAPRNRAHASYSALNLQDTDHIVHCPVKRLSTLMTELRHDHLDLLKMDIEGAEFEVIASLLADNLSIETICVEFHRNVAGIGRIVQTIQELGRNGWEPIAAEEWNFTLLRPTDGRRRGTTQQEDTRAVKSSRLRSPPSARFSDTYTVDARRYWDHQRPIGQLGGEFNRWKFEPHIREGDIVVDFGCGGGYLLELLPGRDKIGVDPSPLAREEAARRGLHVVADIEDLESGFADIVVSNHALEHALAPLEELRAIARLLRPGGKLILALPIDDWRSQRHYNPTDPNRHLYGWTPVTIANLLDEAGFEVVSARVLAYAWHPRITPMLKKWLPGPLHDLCARTLSIVLRRREVHVIGVLKSAPRT
jgi:FkbM family methyltransferase